MREMTVFYYTLPSSPEGRPGMRGQYFKSKELPGQVILNFPGKTQFFYARPYQREGFGVRVLRSVDCEARLDSNSIDALVLTVYGQGSQVDVRFYARGKKYPSHERAALYVGNALVSPQHPDFSVVAALPAELQQASSKSFDRSFELCLEDYLARVTVPKPQRRRSGMRGLAD